MLWMSWRPLYNMAVQYLVYWCNNVNLNTVVNVPPMHHVQKFYDMITCSIEGPQSDPSQMMLFGMTPACTGPFHYHMLQCKALRLWTAMNVSTSQNLKILSEYLLSPDQYWYSSWGCYNFVFLKDLQKFFVKY